jgi:hypothetical protein
MELPVDHLKHAMAKKVVKSAISFLGFVCQVIDYPLSV